MSLGARTEGWSNILTVATALFDYSFEHSLIQRGDETILLINWNGGSGCLRHCREITRLCGSHNLLLTRGSIALRGAEHFILLLALVEVRDDLIKRLLIRTVLPMHKGDRLTFTRIALSRGTGFAATVAAACG